MDADVEARFERIEGLIVQLIKGNGAFRADMVKMNDELRADMVKMNHELRAAWRSDLLATENRLNTAVESVHNDILDYVRDASYHERLLSTRLTRLENRVAEMHKEYQTKASPKPSTHLTD